MNRLRVDDVIIVERERKGIGEGSNFGDERRENRFGWGRLRRSE